MACSVLIVWFCCLLFKQASKRQSEEEAFKGLFSLNLAAFNMISKVCCQVLISSPFCLYSSLNDCFSVNTPVSLKQLQSQSYQFSSRQSILLLFCSPRIIYTAAHLMEREMFWVCNMSYIKKQHHPHFNHLTCCYHAKNKSERGEPIPLPM